MPSLKTLSRALILFGLLAAGGASAQMPVTQGIPCAQGLPCNAPPPQVLYDMQQPAPGQILQAPTAPVSGRMADSYAAIAFWRSASGVPGYSYGSRRAQNREWAEKYALIECRNAGGVDCVIGLWGANGYFAIAEDAKGLNYAAFAGRLNAARRSALQNCRTHGTRCKVVETIDSMPYFLRM